MRTDMAAAKDKEASLQDDEFESSDEGRSSDIELGMHASASGLKRVDSIGKTVTKKRTRMRPIQSMTDVSGAGDEDEASPSTTPGLTITMKVRRLLHPCRQASLTCQTRDMGMCAGATGNEAVSAFLSARFANFPRFFQETWMILGFSAANVRAFKLLVRQAMVEGGWIIDFNMRIYLHGTCSPFKLLCRNSDVDV